MTSCCRDGIAWLDQLFICGVLVRLHQAAGSISALCRNGTAKIRIDVVAFDDIDPKRLASSIVDWLGPIQERCRRNDLDTVERTQCQEIPISGDQCLSRSCQRNVEELVVIRIPAGMNATDNGNDA